MENSSPPDNHTPPEVSAPMPGNPATVPTQPVEAPAVPPQPVQAPMGVAPEIPVTPPPATPSMPPPPAIGEPLPPEEKPKKKFPLKILAAVIVALLLLSATSTVMYAYNVIPGDAKVQDSIAKVLMKIPFMPKTPRSILESAVEVNGSLRNVALDMDVSMDEPDNSLFSSGKFDLHTTGEVGSTDPQNPLYSYHVSLSNELEVDLVAKDHKTYVKVDKLPASFTPFLSMMGVSDANNSQFLNQWFSYDLTPFTQSLTKQASSMDTSLFDFKSHLLSSLDTLSDPSFKTAMTLDSESFEGNAVYHFHFTPTASQLDAFWSAYTKQPKSASPTSTKLSDTVKNVILDLYIDRQTYDVHKVTAQFINKANTPQYSSTTLSPLSMLGNQSGKDTPVSLSLSLSKFGQPLSIQAPQNAKDLGEFFKELSMEQAQSGNFSPDTIVRAHDAQRRSDALMLLNAIQQYADDHNGVLPPGITTVNKEISSAGANLCSSIIPGFIAALPIDPAVPPATDVTICSKPYHTGYFVKKSVDNTVTVSAPHAQTTTISVTR